MFIKGYPSKGKTKKYDDLNFRFVQRNKIKLTEAWM